MDKMNVTTFADMTSPFADYEQGKALEQAARNVRQARQARQARELALYARPDWTRPDYAGETQGETQGEAR